MTGGMVGIQIKRYRNHMERIGSDRLSPWQYGGSGYAGKQAKVVSLKLSCVRRLSEAVMSRRNREERKR
jgi:hypothetical protein